MSLFYVAMARPEDEADDDPREVMIIASNEEETESLCKNKYQAEGFTVAYAVELLCAKWPGFPRVVGYAGQGSFTWR